MAVYFFREGVCHGFVILTNLAMTKIQRDCLTAVAAVPLVASVKKWINGD